jgi:hypothetical protein
MKSFGSEGARTTRSPPVAALKERESLGKKEDKRKKKGVGVELV